MGGVKIPFASGLAGYSDADVLIHAIIDALLGAGALGDIGVRFPAGDPRYKGIASTLLLKETFLIIKEARYSIGNIDSIIVAERPRFSQFIPEMRYNIAEVLQIGMDAVSVKATTTERLGFTGREEGIAAHATALLYIE
jgi:2-C-methyl-D-erythritol 2,4-cyclodiphosphate synthase